MEQPNRQPIRILLVDDHSLFRESLGRLLEAEPEFTVVATCATVAEAMAALREGPVDVVLLDHNLGSEQGSGLLETARRNGFTARILMVTAGMSDMGTLHAFESGSAGVFLKHSPPSQLVEAIHKVAAGGIWLDPGAVQSLVTGATTRRDVVPEGAQTHARQTGETLTLRERGVLRAVFEGLTNKEIAARLNLSESSVKAVLQQLFDKTGVRTRSQLVRIALEKHSHDWLRD